MSVSVPCGYSCAWRLALRPEPGQNRMNAMICGRKLRRRRHRYYIYLYSVFVCASRCSCNCRKREREREVNICQTSATYAKLELLEYLAEVAIHLL